MSEPVDAAPGTPAPLRVALIGCGKMGLHHLRAIAASGRATVVGIADPAADPEALAPLLPGGALVTGDIDQLFSQARPDVVHIVTPPATHVDLAVRAIDAGCHVYVEKPFALSTADADRILTRAAARGVRVCAGHQVLFEAASLTVRDALGSIGRLVHVESYFAFRMVRRTITRVDQTKDILPHAVYPLVDQLRTGTGVADAPLEVTSLIVDASGEVRAVIRLGAVTASLVVTLNGRPVEQYQQIVGTNGSLRADSTAGSIRLIGPGAGPGTLFTPFRRALQMLKGGTHGFKSRVFGGGAYPGLSELVARFYASIQSGSAPPLTPQSIRDTVDLCERIGNALDAAERVQEDAARLRLVQAEAALPPARHDEPRVLVTGGTGMLGRRVAMELRGAGVPVRVVARRLPAFSARVPGVEYVTGDLGRALDPAVMADVDIVVHCAAETSGGKSEHQRNSVDAVRRLVEQSSQAGVRQFIHISSLAVLKTSREMGGPLDESTPIDPNSLARGPYVWGKAESEILARQLASTFGISLKIVRPGPLVDYDDYQTPGRLGREVGPLYVAIGPKRGPLSVCDVSTAARVIRSYVEDFDAAPDVLNLVETPAPTRLQLLRRFLTGREYLRVFWVPAWVLRMLSGPLKLVQRVVIGSKEPVDVAAAFASETYRTDLAASVIERANGLGSPLALKGRSQASAEVNASVTAS